MKQNINQKLDEYNELVKITKVKYIWWFISGFAIFLELGYSQKYECM